MDCEPGTPIGPGEDPYAEWPLLGDDYAGDSESEASSEEAGEAEIKRLRYTQGQIDIILQARQDENSDTAA